MKDHRRSTAGVVWPSINIALYGAGFFFALGAGAAAIGPVIGVVLNAIWLKVSVNANRSAARHAQ
jgi:hypothetical protein